MQIAYENGLLFRFLPFDVIDGKLRNYIINLINGNYTNIPNKEFSTFRLTDSLRTLDYISVIENYEISLEIEKFKNKLRGHIREKLLKNEDINSLISSVSFLVVNSPLNIRRDIINKCIKFELLPFNIPKIILEHKRRIHNFLLSTKCEKINLLDNNDYAHKLLWVILLLRSGENLSDLTSTYGDIVKDALSFIKN